MNSVDVISHPRACARLLTRVVTNRRRAIAVGLLLEIVIEPISNRTEPAVMKNPNRTRTLLRGFLKVLEIY